MDPFDKIAAYQDAALDFMLDALSLDDFRGDAHRAARVFALERRAHELIRDNQRRRRRIAQLDRALAPDDEELEALARQADERAARDRERDDDDI